MLKNMVSNNYVKKSNTKKLYRKQKMFSLFLVFVIIIFSTNIFNLEIFADNNQNVNLVPEVKKDIENIMSFEEQKKIVENSIASNKRERFKLEENINKAATEVIGIQNKINGINIDKAKLEEYAGENKLELNKLNETLELLTGKKEELEEKVKLRLVEIYMRGQYSSIEILFNSKNVGEMISNYNYLKRVAEEDNKLLIEANEKISKYTEIRNEIEEKGQKLKKAMDELQKKAVLESNLVNLKNEKLRSLTEQDLMICAKIDELEKERKKIEQEINDARNMYAAIPKYVGGVMAWPVPSCPNTKWITAFYADGYKEGYIGSFHTGVDIAPPHRIVGSAVAIAAADGRVIKASHSRYGYGNHVMIDHGGGVYTLYGHASRLLVKAGDMVKKGEPILIIGSTGNSTGPHLHFEVRIGGSSIHNIVNPLPYIISNKVPKNSIELDIQDLYK